MVLLSIFDISFPLTNPVLKFLVILIIILFAPIILNRFKIPHILGLILAGAVVGPHGFNILMRDSGIILSGTAGLLYIMFLAGLEIDIAEFKRNSSKSLVFGLFTFLIPMSLGTFVGYYLLNYSILTSVLLASMFASHTLIAYPIVSKLGVTKNRAVNITVGGTVITDTMALLVLAVVVGMTHGVVDTAFWIKLSASIILFIAIVIFVFPIIGRWFLKRIDDNVSQYIFVLVMVFLGAVLAEAAGIEAIIGAFLAGLALNRLIPSTSPLMNRIEFVGNAVFIPFFLIGVGMLVDFGAFFKGIETIKVAIAMTVTATLAKFLAAWLTQKTFRFSVDERRLIFGLSNAQAAATLAAVTVGYNVILGYTDSGAPIRLLNDSILNGTIVMILFTCTIASLVTHKGAKNISLESKDESETDMDENAERILIPVSNPNTLDELINFTAIIKSKANTKGVYALHVIDDDETDSRIRGKRTLDQAVFKASAIDIDLFKLLRYDLNTANGIIGAVKEHHITDLVLGLDPQVQEPHSYPYKLVDSVLARCNVTTYIYKPIQPIATIKRHIVIIPPNAQKEMGFPLWFSKIWNIPKSTGAKIVFYADSSLRIYINRVNQKHPIDFEFREFNNWKDFLILSRDIKNDDNLVIVLGKPNSLSYNPIMPNIPIYLYKYFRSNSFVLIYPMQTGAAEFEEIDLTNPSMVEPIEKLDEIGKNILKLLKRK